MKNAFSSRWLRILLAAARGWNADNVFKHSAAVSFYTLFSLAPVTIIAIAVMGLFLGEAAATQQFSDQITALIGTSSTAIIQAAVQASHSGGHGLPASLNLILLLVGATTVFAQLQNSLNEIWRVRTQPGSKGILVLVVRRVLSFAMVLTIGFLLLVSLVLSTILSAVLAEAHARVGAPPGALKSVDFVVSFLAISILFALLLKVLPDVHLRWNEVWLGAALTSLLFVFGRYLIALYLGHSSVASIYGTAASLVALLIWVYYSCAIFFFGAEFIRAQHLDKHPGIQPKRAAIKTGHQRAG